MINISPISSPSHDFSHLLSRPKPTPSTHHQQLLEQLQQIADLFNPDPLSAFEQDNQQDTLFGVADLLDLSPEALSYLNAYTNANDNIAQNEANQLTVLSTISRLTPLNILF